MFYKSSDVDSHDPAPRIHKTLLGIFVACVLLAIAKPAFANCNKNDEAAVVAALEQLGVGISSDWILGRGRYCVSVGASDWIGTPHDLIGLRQLDQVYSVRIDNVERVDDLLEVLKGNRVLSHLSICSRDLSSTGIKSLSNLEKLRSLSIRGSVTRDIVNAISRLAGLERVTFYHGPPDPEEPVVSKDLRRLLVSMRPDLRIHVAEGFADAYVSQIARDIDRYLVLMAASGAVIKDVTPNSPRKTTLIINRTTWKGKSVLQGLLPPELGAIEIDGEGDFSWEAPREFYYGIKNGGYVNLTSLSFHSVTINTDMINAINRLGNLQALGLSDCEIGQDALALLQRLDSSRQSRLRLYLSSSVSVDDETQRELADTLKKTDLFHVD